MTFNDTVRQGFHAVRNFEALPKEIQGQICLAAGTIISGAVLHDTVPNTTAAFGPRGGTFLMTWNVDDVTYARLIRTLEELVEQPQPSELIGANRSQESLYRNSLPMLPNEGRR